MPDHTTPDPHERVTITAGIDEATQQDAFANATLQGHDGVALSIATRLEYPAGLSEQEVIDSVRGDLAYACAAVPGLSFEVQIGPDRDGADRLEA